MGDEIVFIFSELLIIYFNIKIKLKILDFLIVNIIIGMTFYNII